VTHSGLGSALRAFRLREAEDRRRRVVFTPKRVPKQRPRALRTGSSKPRIIQSDSDATGFQARRRSYLLIRPPPQPSPQDQKPRWERSRHRHNLLRRILCLPPSKYHGWTHRHHMRWQPEAQHQVASEASTISTQMVLARDTNNRRRLQMSIARQAIQPQQVKVAQTGEGARPIVTVPAAMAAA
jgi:hypothetical protein